VTVSTSNNHFWDSCVLIRYLTENPIENVADIAKFLDEARAGDRHIWMSTMVIAEIKPQQLHLRGFRNFQQLHEDIQAAVTLVTPSVPINMMASRLQSHEYHRTPRAPDEKVRFLSGMDAVHLATCVHVRDDLRVTDIEFHSFDDGWSGPKPRSLSLLNYHKYAEHLLDDADVKAVCDLPRMLPAHPSPGLV
jgi:predicted nucleic acid-binding protein